MSALFQRNATAIQDHGPFKNRRSVYIGVIRPGTDGQTRVRLER